MELYASWGTNLIRYVYNIYSVDIFTSKIDINHDVGLIYNFIIKSLEIVKMSSLNICSCQIWGIDIFVI